jgi:hypothetical protein
MDPLPDWKWAEKAEKMMQQFDISQVIKIYDDAIRRFVRP